MLYEYRCHQCGTTVVLEFPLAHNPRRVACGECGEDMVRTFTSVPPMHFKGTGWTVKGHGVPHPMEAKPESPEVAALPGT